MRNQGIKVALKICFSGFSFSLYCNPLVAAYRGVFRTRSKIHNEDFFAKIVNGLKLLTIFAKKLH